MKTKAERKARRKKIVNHLKGEVKKAVKGAKNGVRTALILPYIPLMKGLIKKAGVKPVRGTEGLCRQFAEVVIKKQSYEENFGKEAQASALGLPPEAGKIAEAVNVNVDTLIPMIIKFIKNMIAKIKAKREAKKELSESEQNVLEAGENLAEAGKEAKNDEESGNADGIKGLLTPKNVLIGVAVIAIIIYLVKRK